ncbi:MAG: acyltransferase family protein [Sedimentisphaerales bacterium]
MENCQTQDIIKNRLASVDALRGFTMFWISYGVVIFIEFFSVFKNPVVDAIRVQLSHVAWEGFRFYDLIFPMFLFLVGVVLPFSLARRVERGDSRSKLLLHIIRRTVILVFLGLMLNGLMKFDFAQMRWPGVLQRIGICYFFASLIVMYTGWRIQGVITVSILVLYWLMLTFVPVPGYGAGVITPEGCLSSFIDQLLIPGKLYYGYGDNEGLISTLPAVSTVLIGVLAGYWLRSSYSCSRKTVGLALAGIVFLTVGYLWGFSFPIIKNIWTSTYVLVAGGWSLLMLALFYWVIDVKGYKKWAFFFMVIGMNPIAAYVLVRIVDFQHTADIFVMGMANQFGEFKPAFLAFSVVMLVWLLLFFLYRKKIFFKV